MIKRLFLLLFLSFIAFFNAQDKFGSEIQNLEKNYSQEKVYLLLDKSNYINGENIWFKSYVFDGYQLSKISTTLFVELYDKDKKLIDKKTILLKNGEGNGSFTLPENLPENVYYLRAYTTWMANFPEEFQDFQQVLVYNPKSDKSLEKSSKSQWTAKVFPESGNFIQNIPTKFAVRLTQTGIPTKNWSGFIIEKDKPTEKITSFKSLDENVGTFNLTPEKGKNYQAIIEDSNGNKQTVDLPLAAESGVSFKVDSNNKAISYQIKGINLPNDLTNYRIIGTINNHLAYNALIQKPIKEFTSNIKTDLNEGLSGVLQLTVFNENNMVIAQRLCFIKPNNLEIKRPVLVGLPLNNNPRSSNNFEISNEKDFNNYTVLVKDASENEPQGNNLLSALWLTGDFTDKIENPAQYFSNKINSDALDALLISEKWTRFNWQNVLSGNKPIIKYKPEKNLTFKGRLAINTAALPKTLVNLILQTGEEKASIFPVETDEKGNFYLNNVAFDEPLNVTYFLNSDKKNKTSVPDNLKITFQPMVDFVPLMENLPLSNYQLVNRNLNEKLPENIEKAIANKSNILKVKNNETLIQEVQIKAKRINAKDNLDKELSTGLFSTSDAQIFDFVNENQEADTYSNILQWLQGRVAGLTFKTNDFGNFVPYIRNSPAKLYLDETQVDEDLISTISVGDIAMVKVIKGGGGLGNVILIYLKKGDMKTANQGKLKPRDNKTVINGYDKALSFIQPNFDSASYKNNSDSREVLYWNSSLLQENNQPNTINFFNNDSAKNYKITIISFNEAGEPLFYDEVVQ